jgi:hypothetical protein
VNRGNEQCGDRKPCGKHEVSFVTRFYAPTESHDYVLIAPSLHILSPNAYIGIPRTESYPPSPRPDSETLDGGVDGY